VGVKSNIDLETDARSIIGSRVFEAPRDLVFAAFTDPKHLAQRWGPDGFTTTTRLERRRTGADADEQDLLLAQLRHGRRQIRRGLDGRGDVGVEISASREDS
jgi:hypothetical protein